MKKITAWIPALALLLSLAPMALAETDFAALSQEVGVDLTKPGKVIMWMITVMHVLIFGIISQRKAVCR